MERRGVPLEQLLVDLRSYHSYLLQDPCANPRAQAYVEARISSLAHTDSPKSDCTGCGKQDGSQADMSSSGPNRSSDSRKRAIVTT